MAILFLNYVVVSDFHDVNRMPVRFFGAWAKSVPRTAPAVVKKDVGHR